ncbi:hypothetical protein T484DRAFT_3226400 [Baffinella frigidus]|nr:hypothetical protein T484DRAFT_3226400 [Cryptophyta sp. CCMP2293]
MSAVSPCCRCAQGPSRQQPGAQHTERKGNARNERGRLRPGQGWTRNDAAQWFAQRRERNDAATIATPASHKTSPLPHNANPHPAQKLTPATHAAPVSSTTLPLATPHSQPRDLASQKKSETMLTTLAHRTSPKLTSFCSLMLAPAASSRCTSSTLPAFAAAITKKGMLARQLTLST